MCAGHSCRTIDSRPRADARYARGGAAKASSDHLTFSCLACVPWSLWAHTPPPPPPRARTRSGSVLRGLASPDQQQHRFLRLHTSPVPSQNAHTPQARGPRVSLTDKSSESGALSSYHHLAFSPLTSTPRAEMKPFSEPYGNLQGMTLYLFAVLGCSAGCEYPSLSSACTIMALTRLLQSSLYVCPIDWRDAPLSLTQCAPSRMLKQFGYDRKRNSPAPRSPATSGLTNQPTKCRGYRLVSSS